MTYLIFFQKIVLNTLINLIIFKTFYKLKFVGCDKNHDFILFLLHKMQN